MERDRFLETQARQQLEQDGCPLYYPAGSLFPVQYPPDQYKKIISYWVDHPRTEGGVFCAQWDDWQRFRSFQERNRHYYKQRGGFARFMTAVRERRRRHHLSEDVRLNCHREQQTPLETWLEFQNYHVHTHEEFGRRAQIEAANLRTAQVTLDGATASEAERAALNVKAHSVRLESATLKVESHKQCLLPWTEQLRIILAAEELSSACDAGCHHSDIGATQSTSVRAARKRKSRKLLVLGPAQSAVSKPAP